MRVTVCKIQDRVGVEHTLVAKGRRWYLVEEGKPAFHVDHIVIQSEGVWVKEHLEEDFTKVKDDAQLPKRVVIGIKRNLVDIIDSMLSRYHYYCIDEEDHSPKYDQHNMAKGIQRNGPFCPKCGQRMTDAYVQDNHHCAFLWACPSCYPHFKKVLRDMKSES